MSKPARKNWQNKSSVNTFQWKNCTQLLMIERIRQSQNFDKPSYYLHCHCKKVNYLWLNSFSKVKILTNLPTTFFVTVKRSTTYDWRHLVKSKFWQTFLVVPSFSCKKVNYFWSNAFGKVKILTNLPGTFIVTVKRSTTFDRTHSAKSKFWQTFLLPSLSL